MKAPDAAAEVPESYRAAVVAARPAFSGLPFTVAGRGWHSLAVDIDGRFIAKFPQGEEAEQALRRERALLAAVRPSLTMAVPDMEIHEGPPLFSLHGKLAGSTLERADYERLDDRERGRLAADLALFFAELHAIDPLRMRAAGAEPVEIWDIWERTLAPVWPSLPAGLRGEAEEALREYRDLPPDPLGEVFGFFDAHGWNMAFDFRQGRLRGIFDFADSGFGPPHREFTQVSLIHPELAARAADAYEAQTGRGLERRRIYLLTAAMRLSEYAGALETGEGIPFIRDLLIEWLEQRSIR